MKYTIKEIQNNKKKYLDLLLLADEQEDMIDRYLETGKMFILNDNDTKCVAIVTELNKTECELKNIAVYPTSQGKGYGQTMVRYLIDLFLNKYKTMYVGTGDVPKALRFYEKCGFQPSHKLENFFLDHYNEPMIEDGIQLKDMVYLRIDKE